MTAPTRMCEGSYEPVTSSDGQLGTCTTCGQIVRLASDGAAGIHNREDLLASVARGDYG